MFENKHFFTISEVANVCGVTPKMLRHYEKLRLFTPTRIDPKTGYRYYTTMDMERLLAIINLKDSGLPLQDIGTYLRGETDPGAAIAVLQAQREVLEQSIEFLKVYTSERDKLQTGIGHIPDRRCVCRSYVARNPEDGLSAYHNFVADCVERGLRMFSQFPAFCEYPAPELLRGQAALADYTVNFCYPLESAEGVENVVDYPGGYAVMVHYRGKKDGISRAYALVGEVLKKFSLVPRASPQEILFTGKSGEILTRIILPVHLPEGEYDMPEDITFPTE